MTPVKNILITGGSGLVGRRLTEMLQQKGYNVSWLSRKKEGPVKTYLWDVRKGYVEESAILENDAIINLAGAGVFDQKWSKDFKKEILESRTASVHLLFNKMKALNHKVMAFVGASAVGIYGVDHGDKMLTETDISGKDFLATVVHQWEDEYENISRSGIRTIKLRIGIVLSEKGGALDKMAKTVKNNVGAALGSGKQWVSWIHIDDLCNMFIHALENTSMNGVYNAVGPTPATNEELTKKIGETLQKPIILPNVPSFMLKILLGSERAEVVLGSLKVSSGKIENAGFKFLYPDLKTALHNLYKK